ncbi:hypothetical protein BCY86_02775 [Pajaroellobacter abortibovis]|uniref:Uncharacterized protein n=1 Tax=Pajaroellobacter abortibovis TaxID=1882918 RepID=A0A1L6MW62_9BACT|nr:hypothetical protein BCY86_02775 [Pajaroellobacter abortibovis]
MLVLANTRAEADSQSTNENENKHLIARMRAGAYPEVCGESLSPMLSQSTKKQSPDLVYLLMSIALG